MAAIQRALYGTNLEGWDASGRPSPSELATHARALRKDAIGLAATVLAFLALALASPDPAPGPDGARCGPGSGEPGRALAGCACFLLAASALVVDILICPCPAVSDGKHGAIEGIGHFAYLTVQCLAMCTVHLGLSAAAEALLLPAAAGVLPAWAAAAACRVHGACHATAEFVTAVTVWLAVLYYPLALGLKQWEEDEVRPWINRGVTSFKPLNLYSHGAALPAAVTDFMYVKRQWLLDAAHARLGLPVEALALAFGLAYLACVHLNWNIANNYCTWLAAGAGGGRKGRHAARAPGPEVARSKARLASSASTPLGPWPYGFMHDLCAIQPPPRCLRRVYVRSPFSLGWLLLPVGGYAVKLGAIAAVRTLRQTSTTAAGYVA